MEKFDVYNDVSKRTNGEIYIGVVGGVRTGKSTFITNFMNKFVLPLTTNKHERERMIDELPQSAKGKSVMTTQPKFVPAEACEISLAENIKVKVRLVDCVGYMVEGAIGHEENGKPRMVQTPWSDLPVPFSRAAEIGTKKVIADHSTIGIVMTSDGSIDTELPRSAYCGAEERTVRELSELGKPFVVILNSKVPTSPETIKLANNLSSGYGTKVIPLDVINMTEEDIIKIFQDILFEFPLQNVNFKIDKWLSVLPRESEIISNLSNKLVDKTTQMNKMSDYTKMNDIFDESNDFISVNMSSLRLDKGEIEYEITANPRLFYKALSDSCGMEIEDDFALMREMKGLVHAKKEYDKISSALESVKATGYGVVEPSLDEMMLAEPEIVKQGTHYGVKLRATAPSLHIMQVEVCAEVSPVMGAEQQSEEMVKNMLASFEGNEKGIWETDMFGKSMRILVNEGLSNKIRSMPEDSQKKMRKTISRIINEGKGGVICILL